MQETINKELYVEPVQEFLNKHIATDKFSKKAFGYWKRFSMFEKSPPYGLIRRSDNKIVAICHITTSQRTKYCNLYYIQALESGKGYGQILFDSLVEMFILQGFKRIKLSSEPEAIDFWCNKNYFYFWSYDKYGSLKADIPLLSRQDRKIHREMVNVNPSLFIPPITKHLINPPELKNKPLVNLIAGSSKAGVYKYFDVIENGDVTKWITD